MDALDGDRVLHENFLLICDLTIPGVHELLPRIGITLQSTLNNRIRGLFAKRLTFELLFLAQRLEDFEHNGASITRSFGASALRRWVVWPPLIGALRRFARHDGAFFLRYLRMLPPSS